MTAPNDPADEPAAEPAKPREGAAAAAKPAPPATRPPSGNNANWDQDEEWRHPPVAPKDEGPLKSLGRSVSEAVTGSNAKPAKPKA